MGVLSYLDPGSGSVIAATAAAGLAGVGMAAKSLWAKQTSRFRKAGASDSDEPIEGSDEAVAIEEVTED